MSRNMRDYIEQNKDKMNPDFAQKTGSDMDMGKDKNPLPQSGKYTDVEKKIDRNMINGSGLQP